MQLSLPKFSWPLVALIILLSIAASLRFFDISSESLWNDELASWVMSDHDSLDSVVKIGVKPDVHPPGYYVLLYYVINHLGDSEWALRFPSAVAGIISVLVIYLIGARLYTYKEGLTAAAILTVSWQAIFYSQEARTNSLLLLSTSVAFYFWFELIKRLEKDGKLSLGPVLGYLTFSIASCYLHYFGLQLIILQLAYGILIFIAAPRTLGRWLIITTAITVSYLPWVPSVIEQFSSHKKTWIQEPELFSAILDLFDFAFDDVFWVLCIVVSVYILFTYKSALEIANEQGEGFKLRRILTSPNILLILWATVPFITSFIQSKVSTPVLTMRNLIILLPPIYLMLARGIWLIKSKRLSIVLLSILVLRMSMLLMKSDGYYNEIKKEQFREVTAYVVQKEGKKITHPMIVFTWGISYFDYYLLKMGVNERVSFNAGRKHDVARLQVFLMEKDIKEFWYMTGHRVPDDEFMLYLRSNCEISDEMKFYGASVLRCKYDEIKN